MKSGDVVIMFANQYHEVPVEKHVKEGRISFACFLQPDASSAPLRAGDVAFAQIFDSAVAQALVSEHGFELNELNDMALAALFA